MQRAAILPFVDFGRIHNIKERTALHLLDPRALAECDGVVGGTTLREFQAEMLVFCARRPRANDLDFARNKAWLWIVHAKRREAIKQRLRFGGEFIQPGFRVNLELRHQHFCGQTGGGKQLQAPFQFGQMFVGDGKASGGGVTTIFYKQVGARSQRIHDIKSWHRTGAATAHCGFAAHYQHGTGEFFGQFTRRQSNHAVMKMLTRDNHNPLLILAGLQRQFTGGGLHIAHQSLAILVGCVQLVGIAPRRFLVLGEQQIVGQRRITQPSSGVDAWRQPKADAVGVHFARRNIGNCKQRQHSWALGQIHGLQAIMHQHAVFAGQRHHIGDGAKRHHIQQIAGADARRANTNLP